MCPYTGRMTVRQAIRELRELHMVETVTGKGTYVLEPERRPGPG
jgi:DNA-binding GntR family transcriptional regulator